MEIKKININDLKPAEYNPRIMPAAELENLKRNISTFGLVDPIIIDLTDNNTVIGGHQRLEVLKELNPDENLTLIPLGDVSLVLRETDIKIRDKNDQKALNISLNKINGKWDYNKLDVILEDLNNDNYIIDLTGFDKIDLMNNGYEDETPEDTPHTEKKKHRKDVHRPLTDDEIPIKEIAPEFTAGKTEEVYIERLMFNTNQDLAKFKKFLHTQSDGTETEAETIIKLLNRPTHEQHPATYNIIFKDHEQQQKYNYLLKRQMNNPELIPRVIKDVENDRK